MRVLFSSMGLVGLPQLCLPQAADQFLNAEAIARTGAGISIAPQDIDPAGVALAIRRLLEEDHYRDGRAVSPTRSPRCPRRTRLRPSSRPSSDPSATEAGPRRK